MQNPSNKGSIFFHSYSSCPGTATLSFQVSGLLSSTIVPHRFIFLFIKLVRWEVIYWLSFLSARGSLVSSFLLSSYDPCQLLFGSIKKSHHTVYACIIIVEPLATQSILPSLFKCCFPKIITLFDSLDFLQRCFTVSPKKTYDNFFQILIYIGQYVQAFCLLTSLFFIPILKIFFSFPTPSQDWHCLFIFITPQI